MSLERAAVAGAASRRVQCIDLLRGWAVIVMVETHVLNGTLTETMRTGGGFQVLTFVNGLVAPSFLFASGMAYAITARRKLNDYLAFGTPLIRQLARLFLVLSIGYLLHIPRFSYHHLLSETGGEAWQGFFQVDVLQCIAVSLLLMQMLLLLLRRERRLYLTVAGLTLGVLLATPIVWSIDWATKLPFALAAYMNGLHTSLFPLFPWSAFLFAGAVSGYLFLEARKGDRTSNSPASESVFMWQLAWTGVGMIIASFAIDPLGALLYPVYDYWRTSPSFVLLRLGLVLLLFTGMYLHERTRGVSPRSVVTLIGRESLIVYVAHLMLIYGKFGSWCAVEFVDRRFGYGEAAAATVILLLLMYILARVWEGIKRGSPGVKYAVELSAIVIFLLVFFWAP